jgi:two-component system chemotaxis response regulator CheB
MKILLADGSTVYRKIFTEAVSEISGDAVVTCATNGKEVLEYIKSNDYDIVVLDVEIEDPGASFLLDEVLKLIPKALVILTTSSLKTQEALCAKLLAKGAFDSIVKPIYDSYSDNIDKIKQEMTDVITAVYKKRGKKGKTAKSKSRSGAAAFTPELILIAASTGGPQALSRVLSSLNSNVSVPILIVQHIPPHFTDILAGNLDKESGLSVKVAESREKIEPGTVYIAPGHAHMKLDKKSKIYFEESPPVHGVRPAADVLFLSVAESFSIKKVLVVILTGMGHDSKNGLVMLKKKLDCYCIAQSKNTCVVYGMPRAAVESGLVDKIADIDDIASEIEGFTI